MANTPKSFPQISSKFMEEKAKNDRQKSPLIELGECSHEKMNDGFKFDLFPSPSSLELNPPIPKASSEPLEILQIENENPPEFNCKYCHKTFTNKQALGGHQNAHKLERSIEKSTKKVMAELGCLNTDLPKYPGLPSVHPFALNQYPNILNRSMINSPYYAPTAPIRGRYHAHSSFSMTRGLHPSVAPLTLVNQAANGPYNLPSEITNINDESKSGVPIESNNVSMFLFGSPIGSDDNTKSNEAKNQESGGSGLDLSLKL